MRGKYEVTWDIVCSYIQHVTLGKISHMDMQHCHFLKIDMQHWRPHRGPHRAWGVWRGDRCSVTLCHHLTRTDIMGGGEEVEGGCMGR